MAIVRNQVPPKSGARAIGMALRDLRLGKAASADHLLGGAQINLSEPLPVYSLALYDISSGHSLEKARQVGWRYLIDKDGAGQVGFADVRETADGTRFTGLAQNRNAERLMDAVHLAQAVAENMANDCEARILDVPALNISAVWLSGAKPVFIPYIDPQRLSKAGAKVDVASDFLDVLVHDADTAKQQLKKVPPAPFLTRE